MRSWKRFFVFCDFCIIHGVSHNFSSLHAISKVYFQDLHEFLGVRKILWFALDRSIRLRTKYLIVAHLREVDWTKRIDIDIATDREVKFIFIITIFVITKLFAGFEEHW